MAVALAVAVCRWRLEKGHDRVCPLQRLIDYNVQKDGSTPITWRWYTEVQSLLEGYYNVRSLARRWHVVTFSYQTAGVR